MSIFTSQQHSYNPETIHDNRLNASRDIPREVMVERVNEIRTAKLNAAMHAAGAESRIRAKQYKEEIAAAEAKSARQAAIKAESSELKPLPETPKPVDPSNAALNESEIQARINEIFNPSPSSMPAPDSAHEFPLGDHS